MNPREHLPSWGQVTATSSAREPSRLEAWAGGGPGQGLEAQRREGPYPCPSFGEERPFPTQCMVPSQPCKAIKVYRHSEGAERYLFSFSALCTPLLLTPLCRAEEGSSDETRKKKLSCLWKPLLWQALVT